MRTGKPRSNTLGLRLVGGEGSGSASTIYGPVRAGLTTTPATNKEAALLELLNSLEKRVEILESKYLEVCAILNCDILPLAERLISTIEKDTTE